MADGVFEVGMGRQGVAAGGVEAGVAEEFDDRMWAERARAPASSRMSASVASSSMSWSTARADRRPPRRLRNSAGASASGQEARSVRHSVMEVRAVPSRSGPSVASLTWATSIACTWLHESYRHPESIARGTKG